ncbi:4Fe-4S dicluster domain-containing protein [Thermodesulforhabdus norvegica]|uniref:4Fe-4S dicluster domain-containing protein n=1 Tax=Thermodesulforhabdus norvegica TaxID=39841 RepID=A0A1I4QWD3_9BACT|nr:4Fe-4S dicluster domain-containing protein [Thermodesulforhabdus norvegica]SFM44020.1 4Fe-4S dicluster domain-containing protein [Thermodesulforhabdus norvegica]
MKPLKVKNLEDLNSWVKRLIGSYRVFAPVRVGHYDEFRPVDRTGAINWSFVNTRLSPKNLFHPHSERMFEFSLDPEDPNRNILVEAAKDISPRVIVGIRPCDAYAMKIMDVNFDTPEYKDPWWVERRSLTCLIGLACSVPCSTCFCKATGSGPFDPRGLDVLISPCGDGYIIEAVSEKGRDLLERFPAGGEVASEKDLSERDRIREEAEKHINTIGDLKALAERPVLDFFNAPMWEDVQFACINCGVCTFLCPTCWCFDIQDEVYGKKGCRFRIWDSCMFPLFTLHGSGHNPRSQKLQRVRQRFMHKLKYYVDKYGLGIACVGCGRCVQFCPVNIDIREVIRLMVSQCECPV